MFALIKNTEVFCRSNMPLIFRSAVYGISAAAIVGSIFVGSTDLLESHIEKFIIWQGIAFSILGLLCLEQLYRNVVNYRLIKLICLNLAIVFAFDAYLFSQNLIFPQLNSDLWQARAAVAMATSVFMTIGVAVLNQPSMQSARITFSRPVAFYTTSLTIAGGLLTILSIGGYYVELYGGSWGTILYTLVLVCGVIAVAAVFASHTVRERMTVLINKHLFSHKYDYRAEWLKLINQLSQPTEPQMIHTRALKVVANLFKCNSGASG
jgi:signal transduction histidine kinase (EC 2.7.13.3)